MYRMQLPPLHQAILKVFIFLPQSLDQKKKACISCVWDVVHWLLVTAEQIQISPTTILTPTH